MDGAKSTPPRNGKDLTRVAHAHWAHHKLKLEGLRAGGLVCTSQTWTRVIDGITACWVGMK